MQMLIVIELKPVDSGEDVDDSFKVFWINQESNYHFL